MQPSPFTSFTMLLLHSNQKLTLTEVEFEMYFDRVVAVLEDANDEKYRCKKEEKTPWLSDVPGVPDEATSAPVSEED